MQTRSKEKEIVSYYGKKLYYSNTEFLRKKRTEEKKPDYRDEEFKADFGNNKSRYD